jgi:ribosomal-protein-alanine N-acetyltransferase
MCMTRTAFWASKWATFVAVAPESVRTRRLRGERPQDEHAGLYAGLFGDAEVAATLWPPHLGGPRTPEQASELLAADILHWDGIGFGPWVFFDAGTGQFVGRAGLERTNVGGRQSVEMLYAVRRDAWGRGYATEMAVAAVERARALGLPEVVGFTLTTNIASQRVLEKAGLGFERVLEHAGLPHWFARLTLAVEV